MFRSISIFDIVVLGGITLLMRFLMADACMGIRLIVVICIGVGYGIFRKRIISSDSEEDE